MLDNPHNELPHITTSPATRMQRERASACISVFSMHVLSVYSQCVRVTHSQPSLQPATQKISSSDNASNRGLILEVNQCFNRLGTRAAPPPPSSSPYPISNFSPAAPSQLKSENSNLTRSHHNNLARPLHKLKTFGVFKLTDAWDGFTICTANHSLFRLILTL